MPKFLGLSFFLLNLQLMYAGPAFDNSHATQASAEQRFIDNLEISASLGSNRLRTHNTHLVISPFETDDNLVSSVGSKTAWKLGVGYYLWDQVPVQAAFLSRVLLELNVYHTANEIHGSTLQYELPIFNNYFFSAPIASTRVMLDFKPTLITVQNFSPYLILGVGNAWNSMAYYETAKDGIDPTSVLLLSNHTTTRLVGDLGVGLSVSFNERLSANAEYIYSVLGNNHPSQIPAMQVSLMSPPSFSSQIYSILFGLSLKV